jgi:hypothetical protein
VDECTDVSPTPDPGKFRLPDGRVLPPPDGWAFLPPGDAGLTRRVKSAGPVWAVREKRGRKAFTRGYWADAAVIAACRSGLEGERADPAYARRRATDVRRRAAAQVAYEGDFRQEVLAVLAFAPSHAALAERLADAVTRHATPVGSGTVARTQRIPVRERAEAAVIAWLRHQTTAYDHMAVPRVKGARREMRRELARASRRLLDAHRGGAAHDAAGCPLCRVLPAAG